MRRIISWVIILVFALVGYNYFFGTTEEKENAKEIVNEVKDLGKASWDLLKSEKEKAEAGKYDEAADKFKDIFERLKGIASDENNREYIDRLADLEQKRQDLERKLERRERPDDYNTNLSSETSSDAERDIERDLSELYRQTEQLMQDMERRN